MTAPDPKNHLRVVEGGKKGGESPSPAPKPVPAVQPAEDAAVADLSDDLLKERLREYQKKPISEATRKAYLSDWKHFAAWCERRDRESLPATPETVGMYLMAHKDRLSLATLGRRLVAIAQVHQSRGYPDPPTRFADVRNPMANLRREKRRKAQNKKKAILLEDLKRMVAELPRRPDGRLTYLGARDWLILTLGWAAALRRAELAALNVNDIERVTDGLIVTIRVSKTDQEGEEQRVGVPRAQEGNEDVCPVLALENWLQTAGIRVGPLLIRIDRHQRLLLGKRISGQAVCMVVQRMAEAIGMEAARYGGHSLRAGLVTQAKRAGADDLEIARQTRHKDLNVMRGYYRDADLFRRNAARTAGL